MAYEVPGIKLGTLMPNSSNFITNQYRCVIASSSVGFFAAGTSGAGSVLGILQNAPSSNEPGEIQVNGVSKVYAGGVLTPGQIAISGTSGAVVSSTAGTAYSHLIGTVLLGAASSSGVATVLLNSLGRTT